MITDVSTEEHYKIEILVDDLFSQIDWDNLNEETVNTDFYRRKLSDAILAGKVNLEPVTLCGELSEFYPVD
tara:strand:+ start:352 stop:564 length:213 start_codon:yes stop_codon:yes gene_type:complete